MLVTRKNHYVPQWYQRGFLLDDCKQLFHLDLDPDTKTLPDGRVVTMNSRRRLGSAACFFATDLYTTFFRGHVNDEIERFLFGQIDTSGSRAVRAFATDDMTQWHKNFKEFFFYMDAQKLRTPKGLDWIRQRYPGLAQVELMVEMQSLRALHCTLWTEGVREIVSAEESDIKFIITDHPVTVYNYACPPDADSCAYPNDPSIALKATQTLFPLDGNHCLILTNLEYARDPDAANPLKNRTNPQPMRQSLVRTDAFIRERKLSPDEVRSLNFILKARARRYIAAAVEEWLYPENRVSTDWASHKPVLLPDKRHISLAGGEIYAGFKDGSTYYQDEFGRTVPENEYLRKAAAYKPGRNDYCGCGSGRKFKNCCEGKSDDERPAWDVLSIRERNLTLYNGVDDIFGFNRGKTWDDVRRELSRDQIVKFYELYDFLWPKNTGIFRLLPKPDDSLRALYTGFIDPRTVLLIPLGVVPYFDEVLIQHPFIHPSSVKPEFSPIESPHQYKSQMLKHLMLFLSFQPFIEAGVVNFFPDPCVFDSQLQQQSFAMASDRRGAASVHENEEELFLRLAREDFTRTLCGLPRERQLQQIRQAMPDLSPEQIEEIVDYMSQQHQADPLALLQDDLFGDGGQLTMTSMAPNYEMSLLTAQVTGSMIVTNSPTRWEEVQLAAKDNGSGSSKKLCDYLSSLEYRFSADIEENMRLRMDGSSGSFRKVLREINSRMVIGEALPQSQVFESLTAELRRGLQTLLAQYGSGHERDISAKMCFQAPPEGFVDNNVQRLLLKSGSAHHRGEVSLAIYLEPQETEKSA